jgi:DNA-binding response OmpR family regulator
MKHQLRVLCADNDDTCDLLAATLGISDIEVKSANTVAAAWRLAQTEPFDLYLLETRLPDGDGFDLCRRLHKFAPQTPIVFYSCEAYPIDRQKGLAAGAAAYLVKPYFDDLAATVLQIITNTKKSNSKTTSIFGGILGRLPKYIQTKIF